MPRLWSAPINHYQHNNTNSNPAEIRLDLQKQAAHIQWISQYIDGHLINGSSGDGWELSIPRQVQTVENTMNAMQSTLSTRKPILFGCLQHSIDAKVHCIEQYISFLMSYYHAPSEEAMMDALYSDATNPFVGFCVNPASNVENENEIEEGLAFILDKFSNYPFAVYQIPQITQSQVSAQSLSNLCEKFENLIILKDTSETDDIIKSGLNLHALFLIKGGDKNMVDHVMPKNDGFLAYHGLMFSTANNYPVLLKQMMHDLCNNDSRDIQNALNISRQITNLFDCTYELAKHYSFGNPYTNCAKMVDYFMAFGAEQDEATLTRDIPITNKGVEYDDNELRKLHAILAASDGVLTQHGVPYYHTAHKMYDNRKHF